MRSYAPMVLMGHIGPFFPSVFTPCLDQRRILSTYLIFTTLQISFAIFVAVWEAKREQHFLGVSSEPKLKL